MQLFRHAVLAIAGFLPLATAFGVNQGTGVLVDSDYSNAGLKGLVSNAEFLESAMSGEAIQTMMENVTIASALSVLKNNTATPKDLMSLVESSLDSNSSRVASGSGFLSTQRSISKRGLKEAKKMLSDMVSDSKRKLDLEQIRCSTFDTDQTELITGTRGDIATFNAAAAAAREVILEAQKNLAICAVKIPILNMQLENHNRKCKVEKATLNYQIATILKDLEVMGNILKLTKCNDFLMLLQCKDQADSSFITFNSSSLRRQVRRLRSEFSQRSLQEVLKSAKLVAEPSSPPVFLQSTALPGLTITANSSVTETETSDKPTSKSKQRAKCALGQGQCETLRGKFLSIDAGIREKLAQLRRALRTLQMNCAQTKADIELQISNYAATQKEAQANLADGTKRQNEAEDQSRLKGIQLNNLIIQYNKEMKRCRKNIRNFQGEICAVRKIRGELMKMEGGNIYADNIAVKDCEVSKWSEEACSKTCGGGVQKLTRSVITDARNGGAACPPLTMQRTCREEECPVDCQVGPWEGWSSCSAKCGGGVRSRERPILKDPKNGGQVCEDTTETEGCNIESCEKPCELSQWTAWTSCSKACNSGSQQRIRKVDKRAEGGGFCAKRRDNARLQMRPCNTAKCAPPPGAKTVMCESKLDVVIVLDSSGSLRQQGWDASVKATQTLVDSFSGAPKGTIRVSLLLFSGAKSYWLSKQCARGRHDPIKTCGMKWIAHFTDDMADLKQKVKAMKWIRKYTLTSIALSLARSELTYGRKDAQSVVVVITDGKPTGGFYKTRLASWKLRRQARLMWVPVTRYAPISRIRRWATRPVRENVIRVRDFKTLERPSTISAMVTSMCPKIRR